MLSVVSPLYRSRAQVGEFLERLCATLDNLGTTWEIVLVDDGCPEDTGAAAVIGRPAGSPLRVLRLERNVGQLAAVMIGLVHIRGDVVIVIDADLQDRPEDIAELYAQLTAGSVDVVAAGRSGRYTSAGRRFTARAFRLVRTALTLGRVRPDTGLFLAARRSTIDRVLAIGDPQIHLVSGLARVGATISTVSLDRDTAGESGYHGWQRLRVAAGALIEVTPLYPALRRMRRRSWTEPQATWLSDRLEPTW